jgi:uncharacterized protein (TIGR03382 family)
VIGLAGVPITNASFALAFAWLWLRRHALP